MHPAELPTDDLLAQCEILRTRRSGPGGQHRNKVETAIVIKHEPTGLVAEANEKRSQAENRAVAIQRLRLVLAVEHRAVRDGTYSQSKPSESKTSQSNGDLKASDLLKTRIRHRKLSVNLKHEDFPKLLAELLDHLAAANYELAKVASQIDLTNSQILKFLKQHPPAFEKFNRERAKVGLPRFKF